jgi:acetyl-CoA carboxylase biotin carboxylase subunit
MQIKKLLVANRGEIAVRIMRSAKEMGISTVAVYSEADRKALHVREADEAYFIGPAESALSYLKIEKIIEAAQRTGADAIHPGYGFLSEKEAFAAAVQEAGLIFVGPEPHQIRQMGDKVEARELMSSLGVPIVPGTGALHDLVQAEKEVNELLKKRPDFKFPLLVKASGGGGGKGMRIVRRPEELKAALERAQSEAAKAFSNPVIFVERYIEEPRHIEVQILGDGKSAVHLFERECSLQRRHQKVFEEAPSPSLSEATRKRMLDVSVMATQKMGYRSAGTLEFIVSPDDDFYFLEMNTRIQVEHPVSEAITGIDLVAEQIRIASGERLRFSQEEIQRRGHAIEARLYAEDPERQFLPQPGKLHFLRFPPWNGIRVDSGVESPEVISQNYDPMIAKVIAYAPTREQTLEKLRHYLKKIKIEGLITNRSFLVDVCEAEFFRKGRYHTGHLESSGWRSAPKPTAEVFALACLQDYLKNRSETLSRPLSDWQNFGHRRTQS